MPDNGPQVVNVDVSFTPPNTWNFAPDTAELHCAQGPGRLILHKSPRNSAWTFVSAQVVNDAQQQFTVQPPGENGNVLMIDDACTADGEWHYSVTIDLNGQQYTSPLQLLTDVVTPPRIQNDASERTDT